MTVTTKRGLYKTEVVGKILGSPISKSEQKIAENDDNVYIKPDINNYYNNTFIKINIANLFFYSVFTNYFSLFSKELQIKLLSVFL